MSIRFITFTYITPVCPSLSSCSRTTRAYEGWEELLRGHLPSPFYLPWEAIVRPFLITSWVLMRYGAFCHALLRLELQNIKLLGYSLESASQGQGTPQLTLYPSSPFIFRVIHFGVWDKDHGELAPLHYSSLQHVCTV